MTKNTPVTTDLTKAEAKALTARIRRHIDAAWEEITKAYDGRAWKAMGYQSWEAYVNDEFNISRRHSYQLIDQGRVISAIGEAAGSVRHGAQISERDARDLKPGLAAVTAEIKSRVEAGEKPKKAVTETVAAAREQRKAEQAKNDQAREAARSALPDAIKKTESYKANGAIPGKKRETELPSADRVAELEEAVRVLEAENIDLKARLKKFSEMEVEYKKGGFEEVIRGKDEVIAVQATRIERESREKVRNLNTSEMWRKRAEEAGWSNDVVIDLDERAPLNG